MTDGNEGSGKYSCPECLESFEDVLSYGRHVRNAHPDKKHLKAIVNDSSDAKEIKVSVDKSPFDDYDILEEILKNSGIKAGKADNIRLAMENYEPDNVFQLQEILRQNGINKSTSFNVLSAYCSRLQIEFPMEIKERLKLQETGSAPTEEDGDIVSQMVKKRLRRHELYIAARTSGMDETDLKLMFPEFFKEKNDKPQGETKKKRLFPPDASGTMIEMTDSEYAEMVLEWKRIKALNQQIPSDIELYKDLTQSIRDAGLFNGQRNVKDEMQLQMMTSSLRTIERRLDKTEPITSLLTNVLNKLNDSGRLPSMIDKFVSRFDVPKPNGVPVKQWSEADFQKMNEKMEEPQNIYTRRISAEKEGEKPSNNAPRQAMINHETGKPSYFSQPDLGEIEEVKKEFGLNDDEASQIMVNLKSPKDLMKIKDTLRRAKNGN
jgi:uncharacterized C2H2 Zn-finger protein